MTLEGGFEAWRDNPKGLLVVPNELAFDNGGRNLWVTRQRPKIDRIAFPRLIRRFLDPQVVFLYVRDGEVVDVASRFGAMPFDVDGVVWSHRGSLCTFDIMIERFGLTCPALSRLAAIVRGADTNRHDLAPQAAGLMAISL